jgi:hypothetical protein
MLELSRKKINVKYGNGGSRKAVKNIIPLA